jgi:cell division protein ZapE
VNSPLAEYERRLGSGELRKDAAQETAVAAFDRLFLSLTSHRRSDRWRRCLARLSRRGLKPTKGLYLWGGVGRGKTLLMDLFYNCLPFEDKLRRHFHRFMADVHTELKTLRSQQDPLVIVAGRIAERTRIICFDEFAVTDIADAMILGNLFEALFDRGVTLAATSNTQPQQLYMDGLQRQRFMPTIALLEEHTEVVPMRGELDYRLEFLEHADVYQHPADAEASRRLEAYFRAMAPDEGDREGEIRILGRPIRYERSADGVAWFEFSQLCDGPRSQDDYIELARCYQTVLISNVPRFGVTLENQARRFIALVDEFYDRKVKLVMSAETAIERLYAGSRLTREFKRTRSRLREMQSHDYLAAAHRP